MRASSHAPPSAVKYAWFSEGSFRQLYSLAKAKGIVGEAPHACAPSGYAKRMPLSTSFREFEE
jgi:hypothetical protein